MSKNLVIVESPAKAKTIKKYLGPGFEVMASYGHVRDLKPKVGAVDPENQFAMIYEAIERNAKHVDAIKKALKKAEVLYLAPDPDREGEAIAWHLYELLKESKKLKNKEVKRIVFNEITKTAIKKAVENPREIAMDLVNAQQARRALDYLVGFTLSPLLWRKIRRGLSAGRVQSPALRLICEREDEIEKFEAKEYWTILSSQKKDGQLFPARLVEYNQEKLEQFTVTKEDHATSITDALLKAAKGKIIVTKVEKKQRKRHPTAPFITSTLQQEAARKLGFSAKRTMMNAQRLYEAGFITYMRTDSVHLAQEAIDDLRAYIQEAYGKENVPDEVREFKTKSKNAQEAHEAVRPTSVHTTPKSLKGQLESDQERLYELIWKRTVACQMIHALIDTVAVDLSCGIDDRFRANGSTIAKPGFMAVYQEDTDDQKQKEDSKLLPPLEKGEVLELLEIQGHQHFTEPPPRFGEASLIKTLEEFGIGRPSTYASIISTLQNREYVRLEKKRFHPTDVGRVVSKFLTNHFTQYVDYGFTAGLEDTLDAVARGEKQWIPVLDAFWHPFAGQIAKIDKEVSRKDVTQEVIDEKCPKCQSPLSIRLGRSGRFIGCTTFPDCDYTRNLDGSSGQAEPELVEGRTCPKCESPLIYKQGPYGKFIGCSGYPDCRFIESLNKPEDTEIPCPKCNKGSLLKRKSRRGKIFYSCSEYPKCKYALWNEPLSEPCPQCEWPILTLKVTKKFGKEKLCPQEGCGFKEEVE
jgi:DNA topoisomerase I